MKKTLDYYMSLPYRLEIVSDSDEGGFAARYPDLPGCITCADAIEDVVKNAQDAKKAWLEAALEDGIEINEPGDPSKLPNVSGQFKIRMPKSLHRSLSMHAKQEGISMNQYCLYLLAKNDATYTPNSARS